MKIKYGMEKDFADFSVMQNQTAHGQSVLQFVDVWSGMMECAVEHGVDDLTEAAGFTVRAAADAAGIMEDSTVIEGANKLRNYWAYGDQLLEWLLYHPSEILLDRPDVTLNLFYTSQELLEAVPKLVEAYPCILETAPDLLEVQQMLLHSQQESAFPSMSM